MLSYTRQQAAKVLKISHKNIIFPTASVLQSRFSYVFGENMVQWGSKKAQEGLF